MAGGAEDRTGFDGEVGLGGDGERDVGATQADVGERTVIHRIELVQNALAFLPSTEAADGGRKDREHERSPRRYLRLQLCRTAQNRRDTAERQVVYCTPAV